uniref:NADH-ubiquinone oxidoreductase chain 6 n=1 Tax=Hypocassida subferruginea TaxID=1425620 RepID=A0A1P8NM51_9CUCU|nr:NADH dehydrogenase subunit 6 [Hypocassida subferruginea]
MFLMTMSMIVSVSFMIMKHPVSMMILILTQTIMVCCLCGMMSNLWWFSYMLFMVMIGGLLVLFMYMTNVASNEKFKTKKMMIFLTPAIVMIMMIMNKETFLNHSQISNWTNIIELSTKTILMKYYNYPSNMILFLMMIFLLVTMIMTVKVTDLSKGALRQKQ